ncbi:transcriptional regulator, AraC family with amidase-like domain [Jannaschia faecimaris]|uniref:Transcriptional regulator, AraC family with amidase-like domain n=1 Tax=Jannaschia faecimaris TaxID=1244108 RepID=A0A1H3NUV9_9RHOB|nr:GlxA family transcriptional regulator [Jannaschia faecimaris]SDY92614.1 transcriptional regulator, AraC family with amidase-like domain [Jannaschia faecimaris]
MSGQNTTPDRASGTSVTISPPARPHHYVFALLDRFTLICLASALDALRLANRTSGATLYTWSMVGEGGQTVTCSAGSTFVLDDDLPVLARDDTLVLVGGIDVGRATTPKIKSWLKREARRGNTIAALDTAAWALATCGLLDGKRATIHWENHDGFIEDFPDVELTKSIFTIDGKIITAAGGTGAIDLTLHLIARDFGEDLAMQVADLMVYSSIRTGQDAQRLSIPTRIGVRHPRLSQVIRMMEASIEEPVGPATLAADVGMSTRQLERLFRRYLDRSPKRYYMELRLARARNLLMQTDMSIINVALACGFASPSHFSKCYRAHYNKTPYRERGTNA